MTDHTQPDSAPATGGTYIIRYALELGLLWIDGSGRDSVCQALAALDVLDAELEAIGAGGVSGPLLGGAALAEPQQAASAVLRQSLLDPENQPNQYGVEFGMSGPQMHFKIDNQLFKLAYEPDDEEEFEFMKRMLINAFSVFTPDVKAAPQQAAEFDNEDDACPTCGEDGGTSCGMPNCGLISQAPEQAASANQFDAKGFRVWVLRNLPDDTIIGNGAWWANHLTEWAQRFAKAAPQPSIDDLCARIKAADDAAADWDYMLDSNDCIAVLRGEWKAPMAMDKPEAPQQAAQVASKAVLTAIRDANLQLVRTGDDAFMLVTFKQAAPQQEVQEPEMAYRAACHLATALFNKHYAHLPDYSSGGVVWGLFDSTAGVISQIDNMVATLVQPAPSGDASLPPSYLGSVLGCSLHGNSVTFNFGDRDEAERWHDAVADAWDAARKEGK